jgi:hypothetical protein
VRARRGSILVLASQRRRLEMSCLPAHAVDCATSKDPLARRPRANAFFRCRGFTDIVVARGALAVATLASGATAFTAPIASPALRLPGAVPPVSASVRPCGARVAPLRLAMVHSARHPGLHAAQEAVSVPCELDAKRDAKRGSGSALAEGVARVGLVSLASTLVFSATAFAAVGTRAAVAAASPALGWWNDAKFWGFLGAMAGWMLSLAAIKDAATAGVEIISENLTFANIIYSSLISWWAFIVSPQNLLLMSCHAFNVLAQGNQLRRLMAHKASNGKRDEVLAMGVKAASFPAVVAAAIFGGPTLQSAIVGAKLGGLSALAASKAGPFTVHCWAPMTKWLISGASLLDVNRPTDKISLGQYTALTLTGAFFTRYALLVTPTNYVMCSVNIALFFSSAWHLGRKLLADYGPKPAGSKASD